MLPVRLTHPQIQTLLSRSDSSPALSLGDQEPLLHRADAGVRIGEAEEVKADRVDEVGPARKVLVQADAVDGAERRGDLVEADQDLELGREADLRQVVRKGVSPHAHAMCEAATGNFHSVMGRKSTAGRGSAG